jgi:hypothetical protein
MYMDGHSDSAADAAGKHIKATPYFIRRVRSAGHE